MVLEVLTVGLLSALAAAGVGAGIVAATTRARILSRLLRSRLGLDIRVKEVHLDVLAGTVTLRRVFVFDDIPSTPPDINAVHDTYEEMSNSALFVDEVVVRASDGHPHMLDISLSNPYAKVRPLTSNDDAPNADPVPIIPSNWSHLAQRAERHVRETSPADPTKMPDVLVRSVEITGRAAVATAGVMRAYPGSTVVRNVEVEVAPGALPEHAYENPVAVANYVVEHVREGLCSAVEVKRHGGVGQRGQEGEGTEPKKGEVQKKKGILWPFFGNKDEDELGNGSGSDENENDENAFGQPSLSAKGKTASVANLIAAFEKRHEPAVKEDVPAPSKPVLRDSNMARTKTKLRSPRV